MKYFFAFLLFFVSTKCYAQKLSEAESKLQMFADGPIVWSYGNGDVIIDSNNKILFEKTGCYIEKKGNRFIVRLELIDKKIISLTSMV